MQEIKFTKMVASGNDFVVMEIGKLSAIAKQICERKYGIGADGLLIVEKSKIADIKMRIFNPDGSEAEMCGNGARCVALYIKLPPNPHHLQTRIGGYLRGYRLRCGFGGGAGLKPVKIETKAGIIESQVKGENVKIKLTDPKDIKLDIPIKINNRRLKINFINTGVPHTVIFVEGLNKIDVANLGRQIRYHKAFSPKGANVDFVEVLNNNSIKMRTYERGVEDETLACGTGAVAASLISNIKYQISNIKGNCRVNVQTKRGEILKVYFNYKDNKFSDVWLEGKVRVVYTGVYYV